MSIESPNTLETEREKDYRMHSIEEIGQVMRVLSQRDDLATSKTVSNEQGISLHEMQFTDSRGYVWEFSFVQGDYRGENRPVMKTTIHRISYDPADGWPSGVTIADFDEDHGYWEYNERPESYEGYLRETA